MLKSFLVLTPILLSWAVKVSDHGNKSRVPAPSKEDQDEESDCSTASTGDLSHPPSLSSDLHDCLLVPKDSPHDEDQPPADAFARMIDAGAFALFTQEFLDVSSLDAMSRLSTVYGESRRGSAGGEDPVDDGTSAGGTTRSTIYGGGGGTTSSSPSRVGKCTAGTTRGRGGRAAATPSDGVLPSSSVGRSQERPPGTTPRDLIARAKQVRGLASFGELDTELADAVDVFGEVSRRSREAVSQSRRDLFANTHLLVELESMMRGEEAVVDTTVAGGLTAERMLQENLQNLARNLSQATASAFAKEVLHLFSEYSSRKFIYIGRFCLIYFLDCCEK